MSCISLSDTQFPTLSKACCAGAFFLVLFSLFVCFHTKSQSFQKEKKNPTHSLYSFCAKLVEWNGHLLDPKFSSLFIRTIDSPSVPSMSLERCDICRNNFACLHWGQIFPLYLPFRSLRNSEDSKHRNKMKIFPHWVVSSYFLALKQYGANLNAKEWETKNHKTMHQKCESPKFWLDLHNFQLKTRGTHNVCGLKKTKYSFIQGIIFVLWME